MVHIGDARALTRLGETTRHVLLSEKCVTPIDLILLLFNEIHKIHFILATTLVDRQATPIMVQNLLFLLYLFAHLRQSLLLDLRLYILFELLLGRESWIIPLRSLT